LAAGFFLRIYNISSTLGFYYDQGRDALAIWNLWHKADFFLIGPTTGIAGIFRAPYYYYLIAPFYLLGRGDPVWPSIFLSLTTVAASFFAYLLGVKIHGKTAGLIAAFITAFSFEIVIASRWLSNPTPMLLLSMLLVWFMLKVTEGRLWNWVGIAAVSGLSLFSFGSAGEVFYFLAIAIFAIWQRKNLPTGKIFFISVVAFFLTFLPLVVFDLKNNFIITGNIKKFFVDDKSFREVTWRVVQDKIGFYEDVFTKLIFHGRWDKERFFLSTSFVLIIFYLHKLIKLKGIKILLLLLVSAGVGLVFFQGNEGNFYDYYLTGYFFIFILFFSIGLAEISKSWWGKAFVLLFLYMFVVNNSEPLRYKLNDNVDGPGSIALKSELSAVKYVYEDAGENEFNVDVYVPPVIPYAYDYLFLWRANGKKMEDERPLLYTLYENVASERLDAWLARQKGIGKVIEEKSFGGVVVQKRERI
jgi:4-amino-4-deoxy-L-arabinose transferase-like glycosyltransferase